MAWHLAHDLVSMVGGDDLAASDLVALAVAVVVLGGYAAWLWRRIPR